MGDSRNNFKEEANRKASPYKLWVLHKWNFVIPGKLDRTEVYFAYNTKPPYAALKHLIKEIVEARKMKIEKAIIYNNQTNTAYQYFDTKTMTMKDWEHKK